MKVGIVVPYSWSFWGGVVDHADQQARALNRLGIETRTIIGCDPPGRLTRALHPRVVGRPERPPPWVLPVGRTAIVPANGSVANIVLAPQTYFRIRRILERESFDLLHLHEPSIPIPCVAALLLAEAPLVGTFHASGSLPWLRIAKPVYGFLLERLDHRLAVSAQALGSAARHFPGKYEVLANGVALPERADPSERQHQLVFVGRNEPRKGLEVLLRSWPCVRAATGARLRVIGTDPRSVRLLLARRELPSDGIDLLGIVSDAELTEELAVAKLLVAPATGRSSRPLAVSSFLPISRSCSPPRSLICSRTSRPGACVGLPHGNSRRSATPGTGSRSAWPRSMTSSYMERGPRPQSTVMFAARLIDRCSPAPMLPSSARRERA